MLPFFQDLSNLVDRCNSITLNVVHQLASLYNGGLTLWKSTFKHVHLLPVYQSLGDLLTVMVTLDAIIMDNPAISDAWESYKRMMQFVRAEPSRYGIDEERVRQFERLLVSLDQSIMSGAILRSCVEQDFTQMATDDEEGRGVTVEVRNNKLFLDEFFFCTRDRFHVAEGLIGEPTETDQRMDLVGAFGLYVLYRKLTPSKMLPDASFYRRMWAVQKKVPLVTLYGRVVWYPSDFLAHNAPFDTKKLEPADPTAFRREYVRRLDESFGDEVRGCYLKTSAWLVGMESHLQPTVRPEEASQPVRLLQDRSHLLLTGQLLAYRISHLVSTFMNLHLSQGVPMPKRNIAPLRQCIEMLKAVEECFARKGPVIAECMAFMTRQFSGSLYSIFRPLHMKLDASKRFDDTKLDVLAAVMVLDTALRGSESMSFTRYTVVGLALRVVLISSTVKEMQAEEALSKMWKLSLCWDWQRKVRQACNCTFLYWTKDLLSNFVEDVWDEPEQSNRLPYVLSAFSDARSLLMQAQHRPDPAEFKTKYAALAHYPLTR
jgi:WASH complex subunit 7